MIHAAEKGKVQTDRMPTPDLWSIKAHLKHPAGATLLRGQRRGTRSAGASVYKLHLGGLFHCVPQAVWNKEMSRVQSRVMLLQS